MVTKKANGYSQACAEPRADVRSGLWEKLQFNEWTFSLSLLTFTLTVALAKVCINYGNALRWPGSQYMLTSIPDLSQLYTASDTAIPEKLASLMKAFICGLAMTSFTWYIIYKDSYIPGINPPSPFGSARQRYRSSTGLQLNYLVGLLNGILIFLYMCL